MSDTPAQIRALYDTDPDRNAYDAIAAAVQDALTARDELITMLTARALETGGQVAAVRAFADRHRERPGEVSAQGMVRMLDNLVGRAPEAPARTPAGLPRRETPVAERISAMFEEFEAGESEHRRKHAERPPTDPRTAK